MKKKIDVRMVTILTLLFLLNLADYYFTKIGFEKGIIIKERNFLANLLGLNLFFTGKLLLGFCLPILYLGRKKRYIRLGVKISILVYIFVLGCHILHITH